MTHPVRRSPASSSNGSIAEAPEDAAAAPEPALRPARLEAQAMQGGAPQRRSTARGVARSGADQLDLVSQQQADAQAPGAEEHERSSRRRPREEPPADIEGNPFVGDDNRRQVARREGMASAVAHRMDDVHASALSLANLPAWALQLVADATNAYDVAMGLGNLDNANIQEHLGPHIQAARIAVSETPQVTTLQQFQAVLLGMQEPPAHAAGAHQNAQMPPSMQAEVLAALGGRILALPLADQAQALQSFLVAFPQLGGSNRVLDELRLVEAQAINTPGGPLGALSRRENLLVQPNGAARAAVDNGESVQEVARRYAISGDDNLTTLEQRVTYRVTEAVAQGEGTVAEVAGRHGVNREAALRRLELRAVKKLAAAALARGETSDQFIARLGISNQTALIELGLIAARHAVEHRGMTVYVASEAFGLNAHHRRHLGDWVAEGVASDAVRAGENLIAVADRLGINAPTRIAILERVAFIAASSAIEAGQSLPGVAAQTGIRNDSFIATLARTAPLTSFEQFRALLGAPPPPEDLPPAVLAQALARVAWRIMSLPPHDQERAAQTFVAFAHPGAFHPLLYELWHVANQGGAAALNAREQHLVGVGGAARAEISRTSVVPAITTRYAISGAEAIGILESASIPYAVESLIRFGSSVQHVGSMRGITTQRGLADLQMQVALDVGVPELVRGVSAARVIRRLGISDQQALDILNNYQPQPAVQPDAPQAP